MRGFRIELGEIETLLEKQQAVRQAVVVLREDVAGDQRLVAYLTLSDPGRAGTPEAILAGLRPHLPAYMVPTTAMVARKSVVLGTGGAVRVNLGGRRYLKKKH